MRVHTYVGSTSITIKSDTDEISQKNNIKFAGVWCFVFDTMTLANTNHAVCSSHSLNKQPSYNCKSYIDTT